MKKLYTVEKFAFVDTEGMIYTSLGTMNNIDEYEFDYHALSEPAIFIKDPDSEEKKVVIAVPIRRIPFNGRILSVCFMEIDINVLLDGLSIQSDATNSTFCNLYYKNGVSLTNVVLGGLSSDRNLLDALKNADFNANSSYEQIRADFSAGNEGVATFIYDNVEETIYYIPIDGTDWMLTYLIRESMISEQIDAITQGIVIRSLFQGFLNLLIMSGVFYIIILQNRKNGALILEKEKEEAENRVKRRELEERLKLQEQILEQERRQRQQGEMITAMASDYRSVYYIDLDNDQCVCYRADAEMEDGIQEGDSFPFHEKFTGYANHYVSEADRDGFLRFIDPEHIRDRLENEALIAYRYLTVKNGAEQYEMLRLAGVRQAKEKTDRKIHAIGAGFSNVDKETREAMTQSRALSDALAQAEEANAAKTSFLSSMSHEIRTPMNAIIGLDSIALKNPDLPEKTREQLEKIGGSAKHLLGLINDILDMSRIESGRMTLKNEEFSFREMLEQINTMIHGQCAERGLNYECRIVGHVDDFYIGDDMKLKQVIINILGNAVKFTPPPGSVYFIVERTARYDGKATFKFIMRDTGIGMDKSYLPKIFEAFSQEDENKANKYGSTGLGMAITKNIVEMMNGNISVKSEKGVGSEFTVNITLRESGRVSREIGEIRPQDIKALIIDDDPVACEHAKLVLEEVGIAADVCQSGAEALHMLELRRARRDAYNLILVDWKMPEQDGVEVTRQIRKLYNGESTIIILTAYSWDDVIEEALEAGVDNFMAKPLFASNVLQEFKRAMTRKHMLDSDQERKADLTGRRVLLAEDMMINAEIMRELLEMRDMEVEHAENGQIAVEMFTNSPARYFDAILMDVRMPVMNGLEAVQAIRASDHPDAKKIPIIAMTANAFDEDVQRSLQVGMNAHLTKPVEPEHLYQTLESLIQDDD